MLTIICLYATMGQAWNILGGYAGQISIGHGLFFGLGAYTSAIAVLSLGLNPWIGGLLAIVVAAGTGVLIGLTCFRLRSHYFVIATLVVAESAFLIFSQWSFVGGAVGLRASDPAIRLGQLRIPPQQGSLLLYRTDNADRALRFSSSGWSVPRSVTC